MWVMASQTLLLVQQIALDNKDGNVNVVHFWSFGGGGGGGGIHRWPISLGHNQLNMTIIDPKWIWRS